MRIIISIILILSFPLVSFAWEQPFLKGFYKGKKLYEEGKYEEASESLEKSIEENSNFAPAFNYLGLTYKALNIDLAEVIWYFKVAVEIDQNYATAYDNLGKAYYGLGYFDKAITNCRKALDVNPNLGSAQLSLAWIYLLGKSQPKDAIYHFEKVVKRYKIPYAYFGLGMAYFMNGDRALILETITDLRGMDQEGLAAQLEQMARDNYYIPPAQAGPLVHIKRRPEREDGVIVRSGVFNPSEEAPLPEIRTQDLGGQTMRVRLKGRMVNMKERRRRQTIHFE